uniref:Ig-like domain-containing protein n=1 Tax=Musca domestica TaxID=7370 RepID=A0A1I8M5M5_MUSDO
MSMAFQLNIIEISSDAQTIITGPSDLYVKVGSVITLTCLVSQPSIKDIGPIHWYRGEHLLMPFAATDETAPQRNYFVTPAALTSKSASFDHAAIPGSAAAAALDDVDVYDNNVDDDEHMSTNGNNEITLDFRQRVAMEQKLCDTIKSKLRISNAQISDSGNYTCQPTTSSSASVTVHVINEISSDAQTIITGPSDLYVKVGSVITLTCLVSQPSIKDIGPIHWYRGEHLLMPFAATDETAPQRNYFVTPAALTSKSASFDHAAIPGSAAAAALDDVDVYDNNVDDDEHMSTNGNNEITLDFRQRVAMEQKLCDTIKSKLRISNAQISDSGNYTCQPTTSSSASVTVHVINDENPAAMQKGGTASGSSL